jgi:hypothetical protein
MTAKLFRPLEFLKWPFFWFALLEKVESDLKPQ